MRATKTPQPIETKLDLAAVRVELYDADDAADPPGHGRAIVIIPGSPEPIRVDLPLSEVLAPRALEALAQYKVAFVRAALGKSGFVEAPEPEPEPSNELPDR
jgi:hypothetical protein